MRGEPRAARDVELRVGLASCGVANGARPVHAAVDAAVREAGCGVVKAVGCGGSCHREPIVEVVEGDGSSFVYTHVTPERVPALVRRHLDIPPGEDTDSQRLFTLDKVACVGCCSLAPVMMIEEDTAGRLTPATARQTLDTVAKKA